jgi:hypothetical protein
MLTHFSDTALNFKTQFLEMATVAWDVGRESFPAHKDLLAELLKLLVDSSGNLSQCIQWLGLV